MDDKKQQKTPPASCPCKRTACPRHGKCGECLKYHQTHNRYPAACRRCDKKPAGE